MSPIKTLPAMQLQPNWYRYRIGVESCFGENNKLLITNDDRAADCCFFCDFDSIFNS